VYVEGALAISLSSPPYLYTAVFPPLQLIYLPFIMAIGVIKGNVGYLRSKTHNNKRLLVTGYRTVYPIARLFKPTLRNGLCIINS